MNSTQPDSKKLCDAFEEYRKKNRLTWELTISYLKQSSIEWDFGLSPANVMGIFGIGGGRSPVKKDNYDNKYYYKLQLLILRELNNYINPKIAFDSENKYPLYEEDGNFKVLTVEGNPIETPIDKDEFRIYYWRHHDVLGEGLLTLFKSNKRKAVLEILYPHRAENLLLEGEYEMIKGIVSVNLHNRQEKGSFPLTQLVFLRNPGSDKHCHFACYSTSHRGR